LSDGATFAAAAAQANLTSILDNTPRLTVFWPADAAMAAVTSVLSKRAAPTVDLLGHVVHGIDPSGRVGYTPYLEDGMVLKTLNGLSLTVTKKGEKTYVNGALITKANVILYNGVAHFVDMVISGPFHYQLRENFRDRIPLFR
jgi:uncharacterized surface protein with fasciclin (FAS1) repeats